GLAHNLDDTNANRKFLPPPIRKFVRVAVDGPDAESSQHAARYKRVGCPGVNEEFAGPLALRSDGAHRSEYVNVSHVRLPDGFWPESSFPYAAPTDGQRR